MSNLFQKVTRDEYMDILQTKFKELGPIQFTAVDVVVWMKETLDYDMETRSVGWHLKQLPITSLGTEANRAVYRLDDKTMEYVFADDPFFRITKNTLIALLQRKFEELGPIKFTAATLSGWIYAEMQIPLRAQIVNKQLLILGIQNDDGIPRIFKLSNLMVA